MQRNIILVVLFYFSGNELMHCNCYRYLFGFRFPLPMMRILLSLIMVKLMAHYALFGNSWRGNKCLFLFPDFSVLLAMLHYHVFFFFLLDIFMVFYHYVFKLASILSCQKKYQPIGWSIFRLANLASVASSLLAHEFM